MTNLLAEARSVLDAHGYRTLLPRPDAPCIFFENHTVLGIVHVLSSVNELLEQWEALQDRFLQENAHRLAIDPYKSWNCYSVFLTTAPLARHDASALFAVEEDFRSTRKLVRAAVTTHSDVEIALAPLLPLRRMLTLGAQDMKARLASRLGAADNPLQGLLTNSEARQVALSLIGTT